MQCLPYRTSFRVTDASFLFLSRTATGVTVATVAGYGFPTDHLSAPRGPAAAPGLLGQRIDQKLQFSPHYFYKKLFSLPFFSFIHSAVACHWGLLLRDQPLCDVYTWDSWCEAVLRDAICTRNVVDCDNDGDDSDDCYDDGDDGDDDGGDDCDEDGEYGTVAEPGSRWKQKLVDVILAHGDDSRNDSGDDVYDECLDHSFRMTDGDDN